MRRREFINSLAAWRRGRSPPHTQQAAIPVIGFLQPITRGVCECCCRFAKGYAKLDLLRDRTSGSRSAGRKAVTTSSALASELVNLPVALLFAAGGPPSAFAAKGATSTIPVVFSAASDPVEIGLVPSLNQPGGNVTGMALFSASLGTKRLELMKELMPNAG